MYVKGNTFYLPVNVFKDCVTIIYHLQHAKLHIVLCNNNNNNNKLIKKKTIVYYYYYNNLLL